MAEPEGTTTLLQDWVDISIDEATTQVTGQELGLSEILYNILLCRAGQGIYYHVGIFDSTREVTESEFKKSFSVLVNFQPLLRMKINSHRVSDQNERQYLEPISGEDALDIKFLTIPSAQNWTELLEKHESAGIHPETGPLWKAIVAKVVEIPEETKSQFLSAVEKSTDQAQEVDCNIQKNFEYVVVFFIHHGIVEAVSCFDLICNQFLPILNKIINNKPPDAIYNRPLPLAPTFESVFLGQQGPANLNSVWYMKVMLNLLRWKNRTFGGAVSGENWRPVVYSQQVPNDTPKSCFSRLLIPSDTTLKIITNCRHHGIGVHSILLTAFSYAIAQTMKEFGANPDRVIKHHWPIDLRKFKPEFKTPQTLGYFAVGGSSLIKLPENFEFDKDQAWSSAKTLNKSVKDSVNKRGMFLFGKKLAACMVDQIKKSEVNPMKFMEELGLRMHFGLSNLGNCDAVSKLEVTYPNFVDLKENYFGVAMNDATYLLKDGMDGSVFGPFIGVLTFKGCLNIAVNYCDRWMSREFITKFLSNTKDKLNEMCK